MKVKKGSENGSKKIWKCKKGCISTNQPCRHLERLLHDSDSKRPQFESVHQYAGQQVDRSVPVTEESSLSLRERLREFDLDPIVVLILILRYDYDEFFEDISKELKIHNTETVKRLHNEALKVLRGKWR